MTVITATYPDGAVLVWRDGVIVGTPPGADARLTLVPRDRLAVTPDGPWVTGSDLPGDPWAFYTFALNCWKPPPKIVAADMPELEDGGPVVDPGPFVEVPDG